jgi:hypothetical protein
MLSKSDRIRFLTFLAAVVCCNESLLQSGWAAGKKVMPISSACPTSVVTPEPVRKVVLTPIATQLFRLPNGSIADIQVDLQKIFSSVVTQHSNFEPLDYGSRPIDPCAAHLELRADVTSFQLNATQVGFSLGFSPSGPLSVLSGVSGKTHLNVGNITMDFSIFNCVQGVCSSVAASTANHRVVGGDLSLEVDFSVIKTGPSLVVNTSLGDILRKIMVQGVADLEKSRGLDELPWQARVISFNPATGVVVFDAGRRSRIGLNQYFEIYAPLDVKAEPQEGSDADGCDPLQVIAYAHTIGVNAASSAAVLDRIVGSRCGSKSSSLSSDLIQRGDVVMIHVGGLASAF